MIKYDEKFITALKSNLFENYQSDTFSLTHSFYGLVFFSHRPGKICIDKKKSVLVLFKPTKASEIT